MATVTGSSAIGDIKVSKLTDKVIIDIVDSKSGLSKQLNMAFGISRPDDSIKDKLKKKAVNEIYNTKPESETGRFNIFARLKNKLKDKKLATLRGSKEFIEPLEKELNQRSIVDKDYKQLIEKHTKNGAEKNKLVIKDLEKLVDENNKSIDKIKKEIPDVAITTDNLKGVHLCYINGKLEESITGRKDKQNVVPERPNVIGGNNVFAKSVAEGTLAYILASLRRMEHYSGIMRAGGWKEVLFQNRGLRGKTVGVVGFGTITKYFLELIRWFGCEVLIYSSHIKEEEAAAYGGRPASLEEIFSTCSVVSNHLANNPQTRKMLTYKHFSSMLPYATFLNTGRGAQVVEEDLVRALTERPDLTAVLDVTHPEPSPAGHPFYSLPNCFMTPHIAGSLGGEVVRMAEYMVDEYERLTAGVPVKYEVTLKMLETMA